MKFTTSMHTFIANAFSVPRAVVPFGKLEPQTDLTPDHKNGIHLWQFLLSLLRQPKFEQQIKWLDEAQGKVSSFQCICIWFSLCSSNSFD